MRGESLNQLGQCGGGSGASISETSMSKARSLIALADSIERGRVEQISTASLAKATSPGGGAWPGFNPVSS